MSDYEYRVVDARGQQAHVGPFHREERARGYAQDLDIGPFAPHVVQRRTVTRGAWENIPEASGRVPTKEDPNGDPECPVAHDRKSVICPRCGFDPWRVPTREET